MERGLSANGGNGGNGDPTNDFCGTNGGVGGTAFGLVAKPMVETVDKISVMAAMVA